MSTLPESEALLEKPVESVKQSTPRSAPNNEKVEEIKPVALTTSQPEPATAPQGAGKRGLKNPKTGEVATTYSNYRFTKRWIKEALVEERLLEKVYKNDELNAEIEAKINNAILKLVANDKYRV